MHLLEQTIREAPDNAPPEHLQLALTALLEARFVILAKGSAHCAPPANLNLQALQTPLRNLIDVCPRIFDK
ncbi:MAG TPA: hypothetical protein VMU80_22650 [Bryobacteraceae bacterium]|nr:hypothetical protein [Bryobacteraceae bacterium]